LEARESLVDFSKQEREILDDAVPDDVEIDIEVRVDQAIAHRNYRPPGHGAELFAGFGRELIRCFSNDLHASDQRVHELAVLIQVLPLPTCSETERVLGGVADVG
jgi:hypothetical protein